VFDRSLVTSGFDVEVLVSEEYIDYLLLAQVEAGLFSLVTRSIDDNGHEKVTTVYPPAPGDYVRRYDPHPAAILPDGIHGSLKTRLLPEGDPAFLYLLAFVQVDDLTADTSQGPLPAGLLFNLNLEPGSTSDGFESGHKLTIEFVGFDASTKAILEANAVDVPAQEQEIRDSLPDGVPLGIAQGRNVRRIRMRKFVTDERRSLGFYIDLALRSDPGTYTPQRGNVDDAQDFRSPNAPLALATSPGLFGLLGPDLMAGLAEPNDEGDGFVYPLREDMFDTESDEIGRAKGITVGPELLVTGSPPTLRPSGRLMIDVHGEYTDAPGDPDFHLQIFFAPVVDSGGVVTWDPDVDVDLGLLATLLLIGAGIGISLLFAGWGSALVIGPILGVAVLKDLIAEPLATKIVADRLDVEQQASVLDVIPFKLDAASRRWDPFFKTHVLVLSLLDEPPVIDPQGIAFEAARLALDKEPIPEDHVVIRDEDRTTGSVTGLRYRVRDFDDHNTDVGGIVADFRAIAPSTDRLDYARSDPVADPSLVSLTLEQLALRIPEKKVLAPLIYTAERISMFEGQVDQILVLTSGERAEEKARVERRFRAQQRAFIEAEYGNDIRQIVTAVLENELGRQPTNQEVTDAFNAHVTYVIETMIEGFRRYQLPYLLEAAIARALRFDLAPDEFIELQHAGILVLDGLEILVRHNADGTETPYYRDHPDGNPRDNLLAKRHYSHPYVPPGP
jgi:hypothetical protein